MKACSNCGEVKPLDAFWARKEKRRPECKLCGAAKQRDWRRKNPDQVRRKAQEWSKKNPEKTKERNRKTKLKVYGLSLEEFRDMFQKQGGKCAICGTSEFPGKGPCVDHDHTRKNLRGILCSHCNTGIGLLKESPVIFARALAYLKQSEPPTLFEMLRNKRAV